ncbi:unnamed protein product [Musa banksii]
MHSALWVDNLGNSWRTTFDINNSWESMVSKAYQNKVYAKHARPNGWNGNRSHHFLCKTSDMSAYVYSLLAASKAPLIIGCDVRSMTKETLVILMNMSMAFTYDPLGVQAKKVQMDGDHEVWAGSLSGYRTVVC